MESLPLDLTLCRSLVALGNSATGGGAETGSVAVRESLGEGTLETANLVSCV